MSLYPNLDKELSVAFESFSGGTLSIGSLASILQSSILIVESIEDKKLRKALQIAEGSIDALIAAKFGEDGFKEMYSMYNNCSIFEEIVKIIEPLKTYLNEGKNG